MLSLFYGIVPKIGDALDYSNNFNIWCLLPTYHYHCMFLRHTKWSFHSKMLILQVFMIKKNLYRSSAKTNTHSTLQLFSYTRRISILLRHLILFYEILMFYISDYLYKENACPLSLFLITTVTKYVWPKKKQRSYVT